MRHLVIVSIALALGACASVFGMSEAEVAALSARLEAQYGPTCAVQNPRGSDAYNYCVVGFYQQERANRAAALAPPLAPPATKPFQQDPNMFRQPQVNCQSFVVGGIVQTRCQ